MPIATKNNSLIIKDGKLADGCVCCGGWNCYQDCSTPICSPCGFAGSMPSSVTATLSFDFPEVLYLPRAASVFGGIREWSAYKVLRQDAAAAAGTFTLLRQSQSGVPTCVYTATFDPFGVNTISVLVGGTNSVFNNGFAACQNTCLTGLDLRGFSRWIAAKGSYPSYGGPSPVWINASQIEYPYLDNIFVFVEGLVNQPQSPGVQYDASTTSITFSGFKFLLNAQNTQVEPCVEKPFLTIYAKWVFDLEYTDISGPVVINRTLPKAMTLIVSQ